MSRMPYGETLKDRATQLLIKYKSGALVTQKLPNKGEHMELGKVDLREVKATFNNDIQPK